MLTGNVVVDPPHTDQSSTEEPPRLYSKLDADLAVPFSGLTETERRKAEVVGNIRDAIESYRQAVFAAANEHPVTNKVDKVRRRWNFGQKKDEPPVAVTWEEKVPSQRAGLPPDRHIFSLFYPSDVNPETSPDPIAFKLERPEGVVEMHFKEGAVTSSSWDDCSPGWHKQGWLKVTVTLDKDKDDSQVPQIEYHSNLLDQYGSQYLFPKKENRSSTYYGHKNGLKFVYNPEEKCFVQHSINNQKYFGGPVDKPSIPTEPSPRTKHYTQALDVAGNIPTDTALKLVGYGLEKLPILGASQV